MMVSDSASIRFIVSCSAAASMALRVAAVATTISASAMCAGTPWSSAASRTALVTLSTAVSTIWLLMAAARDVVGVDAVADLAVAVQLDTASWARPTARMRRHNVLASPGRRTATGDQGDNHDGCDQDTHDCRGLLGHGCHCRFVHLVPPARLDVHGVRGRPIRATAPAGSPEHRQELRELDQRR